MSCGRDKSQRGEHRKLSSVFPEAGSLRPSVMASPHTPHMLIKRVRGTTGSAWATSSGLQLSGTVYQSQLPACYALSLGDAQASLILRLWTHSPSYHSLRFPGPGPEAGDFHLFYLILTTVERALSQIIQMRSSY